MQKIPIRKLFWEALEMALETKTHQLAKDIANAIGENETPLLKALREDKISAYLFDEPADQTVDDIGDYRCTYRVESANGSFLAPCGQPIVWKGGGGTRCLQHSLCTEQVAPTLPTLRPVAGHTVLISKTESKVYSEDGVLCGKTSHDSKKAYVFEVQ
jgi:hypothetical protein